LDISKLRQRVIIQEQQGVSDGGGNLTENWVDIAIVWANVKPLMGQETTIAEKLTQQLTHTVTMRYRAIAKAKNRLLFNGRVFYIEYIMNVDEKNRELRLNCREV
jgi:SPP1 family predicted phage head-tail adaptor